LVIIWLKRWLARLPIEAPLEPAPVGVGVGVGARVVVGVGVGVGVDVGVDVGLGEGEGVGDAEAVGVGEGDGLGDGLQSASISHVAIARTTCTSSNTIEITAVSAAERTKRSARLAMVSARTGCRRHRPAG
jgi:hypothetical protein